MEIEINEDRVKAIYNTPWRAFFKNGIIGTSIVYGESEDEAMRNALALARKNNGSIDFWPIDKVVDHVEIVG